MSRLILLLFVLLVGVCVLRLDAAVDPVTGELLGSTFIVKIDGKVVPTRSYEDMDHLTFAWSKSVTLTVSRDDGKPIVASRIRPLRLEIPSTVAQSTLQFKLDKPQHLVINIDKLRKLVVIPQLLDPDRPDLNLPGVINVQSLGADPTGKVDNTAILQQAIDNLPTNGTLYFPAGCYRTGSLNLKSDMTLYVDAHALIKGSDDFKQHRFRRSYLYFIKAENAQNIRILGHGIIDANGGLIRRAWQVEKNKRKVAGRCFLSVNVKNLTIKNVTFRESYSWNVHFVTTDNLHVDRVKVFSSMSNSNGDGFDVDGCDGVLVENCLIFAEDDAITPKASWTTANAQNYVFRNCILWSQNATGIRVGDETKSPEFANMLFENIDILRANTMIRLNAADGGDVHDLIFRNFWLEEYTMHVQDLGFDEICRLAKIPGKKRGPGQTYMLQLYMHKRKPNSPAGLIRDVLLENIHSSVLVKSKFSGMPRPDGLKSVRNITFRNYTAAGQCQADLKAMRISVDEHTQGVKIICD